MSDRSSYGLDDVDSVDLLGRNDIICTVCIIILIVNEAASSWQIVIGMFVIVTV